MRIKVLIIIAICMCFVMKNKSTYCSFVERFEKQYEADRWKRETDSLYYIAVVMNLVKHYNSYCKLDVNKRKNELFAILSKGKMYLSYYTAIDIDSGYIYHNPMGDMDYWSGINQEITMNRCDTTLLHPKFKREMNLVIDYIRKQNPDYVFEISNLSGSKSHLYWSIKNHQLFVLECNADIGKVFEYEPDYFITELADETIFDR